MSAAGGWTELPPRTAQGGKRALLLGTALEALGALMLPAVFRPAMSQPAPDARPIGGAVVAGAATISRTPGATTIDQSTQRAALNWQGFDVGARQSVDFHQPSASAVTLNRVLGPNPSQIAGRITANGQVILVNQDGITFYKGAQVNTAGFVATAAGITNRNFMAGHMVFDQPAAPGARVVNQGQITVHEAGIAALVAPQVENSGVITAKLGRVVLAGAQTYALDLYGDGLVSIDVNGAVKQVPTGPDGKPVPALVTNTGTIVAAGGIVQLTAREAAGVVQNLVTAGGTIAAPTVGSHTGEIVLNGIGGSIVVAGQVLATGQAPGEHGGQIEIAPDGGVVLAATARVDASGAAGGGVVAVGTTLDRARGGPGVTPAMTSRTVTVARGAQILADATENGDGGRIAVLSAEATVMDGALSARGGPQGGNGGLAEVSGQTLGFDGSVDLGAAIGNVGTILFDPGTLLVVGGAGTGSLDTLLPTVLYTADGTTATDTVTNTAIDNAGSFANVILQAATLLEVTTGAPINVTNGLTMQSGGNLLVNASVTAGTDIVLAAGTSDPAGAMTLNAPVTSQNGGISLSAGTGGIFIGAPVSGNSFATMMIDTTGAVTQTAPILGIGLLTGTAGSVSLTNAGNQVVQLGDFTASGDFRLVDGENLSVAYGTVAAANIALEVALAGGSLAIGNVEVPTSLMVPPGGHISLEADNLSIIQVFATPGYPAGPVLVAPGGVVEIAPFTSGLGVSFAEPGTTTASGLLISAADLAAIEPGIGTLQVGQVDAQTLPSAGSIAFDEPVDLTTLADALALDTTGAITQVAGATVAVSSLTGMAGTMTLDQANAIDTLGTFAASGSLTLNDINPLTVAGPLSGADVALSSVGTMVLAGGIALPGSGGPNVLLQVAPDAAGQARFVQTGAVAVGGASPNGGTVTIGLPASGGSASLSNLLAPGMRLVLSLGSGMASGTLAAGGLLVQGQGGSATLFGSVAGNSTPGAALISQIVPQVDPAYTLNGCVIGGTFCTMTQPLPTVPTLQTGLTASFGNLQQVLPGRVPPVPQMPGLAVLVLGIPPVPPDQLTDPDVVPPNVSTVDY